MVVEYVAEILAVVPSLCCSSVIDVVLLSSKGFALHCAVQTGARCLSELLDSVATHCWALIATVSSVQ